jgi:hypothetical protein
MSKIGTIILDCFLTMTASPLKDWQPSSLCYYFMNREASMSLSL